MTGAVVDDLAAPGSRLTGNAPATRWQDGHLIGNGRHGAVVFGTPHLETVVVNHHSLVLPNGSHRLRAPQLADRLERTRDLILDGDGQAALELFTDGRPTAWPQPFHPAFALRWGIDPSPAGTADHHDYARTTEFRTGVCRVRWRDGAGEWSRDSFVSRADDVLVCRLQLPDGAGAPHPGDVVVRHEVALPGAPRGLRVEPVGSGRGPGTSGVVVAYPDPGDAGPGYVGVTRCVVVGTTLILLTRVVRAEPGAPARVLPHLFSRCRTEVEALPVDHELLLQRHLTLHAAAFDRVSLDLGVPAADRSLSPAGHLARVGRGERARLQFLFDAGRYHLLSASGLRPPRLVGLWQGDWDAAWSAGFTLDANLGLQLAGAVSAGLPEAVDALAALVADQLPQWRQNATALFGTRGVVSPTHTDGENGAGFHFNPQWPLHLWTGGAHWVLVTLLAAARAGGEEDLPGTPARRLLAELAAFAEDFLTRRDDDGQVVVVPSYSPENAPDGASPAAVNATMDLAVAGHTLRTALELLADDVPAATRERWSELLAALPPYRVTAEGVLAEWAWPGFVEQQQHRHLSHLYPVWPLHEITRHRSPELAAAAARALAARAPEDGSAHGWLHRGLAAARLRDPESVDLVLSTLLDPRYWFDSAMSGHYPGPRVFNADAACGLPGLILECLVDAEPGRLELLPAVPAAMPGGRVRGVPTVAGVVVRELSWDRETGEVGCLLESAVARQVTVWLAGREDRVSLGAGDPLRLEWTGWSGSPVPGSRGAVPRRVAELETIRPRVAATVGGRGEERRDTW